MSDLKQYQININGHHFSVSSGYGEAHIREVERFLNKRFLDITSQSETYGPTNLAMLVALNLADELLTVQRHTVNDDWKKEIQRMCEKLDIVLVKN